MLKLTSVSVQIIPRKVVTLNSPRYHLVVLPPSSTSVNLHSTILNKKNCLVLFIIIFTLKINFFFLYSKILTKIIGCILFFYNKGERIYFETLFFLNKYTDIILSMRDHLCVIKINLMLCCNFLNLRSNFPSYQTRP